MFSLLGPKKASITLHAFGFWSGSFSLTHTNDFCVSHTMVPVSSHTLDRVLGGVRPLFKNLFPPVILWVSSSNNITGVNRFLKSIVG
jgi:hypothetical protein